jgi:Protein of unknown function (DUF4231)
MDDGQPVKGTSGEDEPATLMMVTGSKPPEKKPGRRNRRPALVARFPRIFWHPSVDDEWPDDWPLVRREQLSEYPALADDLRVWCEQLEPRFRKLDHQAQIMQNRFWRQHVALISGGLAATSLGVIQAAMGGGIVAIAVVQSVLTGLLAGLTVLIRSRRAQQRYLSARLKAERIKSEYFLFLARADDYAAGDPLTRLRHQVDDIESVEALS